MTDEQLILALHRNQPKAFDIIFDMLFPELCYYASRLIGDEDAKDIAAESLYTFWTKEKTEFGKIENIRAFLFSVTKNACINFHKRLQVRARHHDILSQMPGDESGIENIQLETEILTEIFQEIESLPDRCREVFKLSYLAGLKRSEVASKLNISENTVRNHNIKALEILRNTFSDRKKIVTFLLFLELQELGYHGLPGFQLS